MKTILLVLAVSLCVVGCRKQSNPAVVYPVATYGGYGTTITDCAEVMRFPAISKDGTNIPAQMLLRCSNGTLILKRLESGQP